MYELYFKLIATVGGVSLLFALGLYRWHNEVELFAVISLMAWSVLAFASQNVVAFDNGTTQAFSSFPMQLFSVGLALISLLALIGAITGQWPSDSGRRVPGDLDV